MDGQPQHPQPEGPAGARGVLPGGEQPVQPPVQGGAAVPPAAHRPGRGPLPRGQVLRRLRGGQRGRGVLPQGGLRHQVQELASTPWGRPALVPTAGSPSARDSSSKSTETPRRRASSSRLTHTTTRPVSSRT